jgi:hypothetical protein
MTSETTSPDSGKAEPVVYYVEDVTGSDFTFYLSAKDNDGLLKSGSQDASKSQSSKFSNSRPLKVVRLSLRLREKDLQCELVDLLKRLDEAAATHPEKDLGILACKLTQGLSAEVRGQGDVCLKNLVKGINRVLTEDNGEYLKQPEGSAQASALTVFARLPEALRQVLVNRTKFDQLLPNAFKSLDLSEVHGRALVCRSYRGQFLSVSFREKKDTLSFAPNPDPGEWPLSIADYCLALSEVIKRPDMHGLLVIAGATNSSKSEIATGLIFNHLQTLRKPGKRLPHLVTLEDPIEKFYVAFNDSIDAFKAEVDQRELMNLSIKMPAFQNDVDYTPRERDCDYGEDKDGGGLSQALEDALRQTPSVFFVGETRKRRDWRQLIDFAGTGHLIVTTTHAGSLTEAMRKIFEALEVKTPSQRNEIANRLIGVIHLRAESTANILLPAAWRRTPTGTSTLTAEGLSSLLPHQPRDEEDAVDATEKALSQKDVGCLGRSWFATRLLRMVPVEKLNANQRAQLSKVATQWDLEGV